MKKILTYITIALGALLFASCADFEEINTNPKAASEDQIQAEYFINKSMVGAMMDPHIAERVFVLYWKRAGRQDFGGGIAVANPNDGWTGDYYGTGYLQGWVKDASVAIQIADNQVAKGTGFTYTDNLKQVARIWRAYLYTELVDNFGPGAFNEKLGEIPEFKSEQECYHFILSELKDAVSKLDPTKTFGGDTNTDHAYGYNFAKWVKYGNSMRMRIAMRISNADAAYAKAEFEDAAKGSYISEKGDIFSIIENNGWDNLTAVMSRQWNGNFLSATLNNMMINLGGVTTIKSIGSKYPIEKAVKPADYFGIQFAKHYPTYTNDPSTGFWFDGLHNVMDPRAYAMYYIPGNHDKKGADGKTFDDQYCYYPTWTNDARTQDCKMLKKDGYTPNTEDIELDATYTWNAFPIGSWGDAGSVNEPYAWTGKMPALRNHFRGGQINGSQNKRVMFASWESYFLIAEAAVKGWAVPMSAKDAYEAGVRASFEYNGVSEFADEYLASESYNRVGTSVAWGHTTEASAVVYNAKDGYTGNAITHTWTKPNNTVYGANNNDYMNKIMTQKFIANTPWLPIETWSDHRRTGLPFFENPAVEQPIQTLPALTQANAKNSNSWGNFPQRLKYPSSLENSNPDGYAKAVQLLGGADESLTPLWWTKAKK